MWYCLHILTRIYKICTNNKRHFVFTSAIRWKVLHFFIVLQEHGCFSVCRPISLLFQCNHIFICYSYIIQTIACDILQPDNSLQHIYNFLIISLGWGLISFLLWLHNSELFLRFWSNSKHYKHRFSERWRTQYKYIYIYICNEKNSKTLN